MTVEIHTEPVAEPKVKTVADVLRHAARIIEERGWCQNLFDGGDDGYCAYGAMGVAETGDPFWTLKGSPVSDYFRRFSFEMFGDGPIGWNDTPGRTAAEVTTALRAAADKWEAEHV